MGFLAPTATSARRSTFPGFQPRYDPPSGFPTLLTVSSLRAFRPRGPVPLMGFSLQSFSPPQSRTSCDACALMPFLASRTLALRTRSSRCPAASGRCSLRRSVPDTGRSRRRADALMGFSSPLQSVPVAPRARLPGLCPHALYPPDLQEVGRPALQGLDERSGRTPLAGRPTLLRFLTRTCPRILPTTVMLRASKLAGRSIDLAGGSLPRLVNSPFTTLSKRSL
jgi:hypothetical protein